MRGAFRPFDGLKKFATRSHKQGFAKEYYLPRWRFLRQTLPDLAVTMLHITLSGQRSGRKPRLNQSINQSYGMENQKENA